MNPSTAVAQTVVGALLRAGVREVVLAPGSRSAALALALHAADEAGRLRLHVRIDERSAGFLALGLAKGSHRPVAVLTTSGTAVANLHPAVLEAAVRGEPDADLGERIHAWVVLREPGAAGAQELIDHTGTLLAGYKRPRAIHFVEELPRNPMGKVVKQRLAAP